ncbi:DUF2225 domain-containing protein [Halobacillus litoralis]|uniref:DUF2225 domain-containing protein n=1 Tax=Halobacillus litoralis TaxID=45668 RepID=UPI001CD2E95F|nr:DUF2225 domain-containing protein [Halobacillus litoralis]MCA0971779.1 DUF2225 domain-containing protein [Halobacillus litoralis]
MDKKLTPTFDREVQCTYCEYSFTTTKIRSRFIRPVSTDTLFFTTYEDPDINPLLYHVHVCPYCGYASNDQFSTSIPLHLRKVIQNNLSSRWNHQDFTGKRSYKKAINAFKLCILTALLKEEKPVVLAGLYLRTAWLYQYTEDPEQVERFMRLALVTYEKAYEQDRLDDPKMTPLKVLYLIGELHRRLGHDREAIQYFSKVIEKKKDFIDPKVVEMARDQWQLTRQERKKVHAQ